MWPTTGTTVSRSTISSLVLIGTIEDVEGAGPFNHPTGLAFDDDGYLYVSDLDNHRILKLQLPSME